MKAGKYSENISYFTCLAFKYEFLKSGKKSNNKK